MNLVGLFITYYVSGIEKKDVPPQDFDKWDYLRFRIVTESLPWAISIFGNLSRIPDVGAFPFSVKYPSASFHTWLAYPVCELRA
ncbi:MAG TPA: hypothetical protein PLG94_15430 [Smithellaceae bacterium]|nr:hypothetical protein [Smithellaceae bacterium]